MTRSGSGNAVGVEALLDDLHVDRAPGRGLPPCTSSASARTARDDLLPAAVVEGDDEGQPGIAPRQVLGLVEQARGCRARVPPARR